MLLVAAITLLPQAVAFHPQELPDGNLLAVSHEPDPIPGDSGFSVHARLADVADVEYARMKYCLSANRNATVCYIPVEMEINGTVLSAKSEHAIPSDQEFGYNLSIRYVNGTTQYYPSGIHTEANAYVFLRTLPAERTAPTPPFPAVFLIAGFAALSGGRLLRRIDP